MKKSIFTAALLTALLCFAGCQPKPEKHTAASFAMDTMITQTVYGQKGEAAMAEVNETLARLDRELSLYSAESHIAAINAAAGKAPVQVPTEVFAVIEKAVTFSKESENAFRVTIAPITLAWAVTSENHRVVPQAEIDTLLPLVNDDDVILDKAASTVMLRKAGQGLDLGGIVKGWACSLVDSIYKKHQIQSAVVSLGGNIYTLGKNPINGNPFIVAFRDPAGDENSYIATFTMENSVCAVSAGYERYFEQDGVKYQHIMDPRMGKPAVSDISAVGVITPDGARADFLSTTLYVWGVARTKAFMSQNPDIGIILLEDKTDILYVSRVLQPFFKLYEGNKKQYQIVYI